MAAITAALIKQVREETGAGMMDVKKALTEADGDVARAKEIIRAKGIQAAGKREGRKAQEGTIASTVVESANGQTGYAVELNSETDFVAKTPKFVEFADTVLGYAVKADADSAEALLAGAAENGTVKEAVEEAAALFGEHVKVGQFAKITGDNRVKGGCLHLKILQALVNRIRGSGRHARPHIKRILHAVIFDLSRGDASDHNSSCIGKRLLCFFCFLYLFFGCVLFCFLLLSFLPSFFPLPALHISQKKCSGARHRPCGAVWSLIAVSERKPKLFFCAGKMTGTGCKRQIREPSAHRHGCHGKRDSDAGAGAIHPIIRNVHLLDTEGRCDQLTEQITAECHPHFLLLPFSFPQRCLAGCPHKLTLTFLPVFLSKQRILHHQIQCISQRSFPLLFAAHTGVTEDDRRSVKENALLPRHLTHK